MLRFVPVERPGGQRELARLALQSARRQVKEALGASAHVGPIVRGGFEVETDDPDAPEQIAEAVGRGAMSEDLTPGLLILENGSIVPDEPSMDGSMIGL